MAKRLPPRRADGTFRRRKAARRNPKRRPFDREKLQDIHVERWNRYIRRLEEAERVKRRRERAAQKKRLRLVK